MEHILGDRSTCLAASTRGNVLLAVSEEASKGVRYERRHQKVQWTWRYF